MAEVRDSLRALADAARCCNEFGSMIDFGALSSARFCMSNSVVCNVRILRWLFGNGTANQERNVILMDCRSRCRFFKTRQVASTSKLNVQSPHTHENTMQSMKAVGMQSMKSVGSQVPGCFVINAEQQICDTI